jgi:ATP-dependent exoDNAse (exonuclease V) beta subunit
LDEMRAESILAAFGLEGALTASVLVQKIAVVDDWLRGRWPDCRRLAEVPIEAVLPNGQVLLGRIDLLIESPDGWVLMDYKASPLPSSRWAELATEYGGQLAAYAEAVSLATGRTVRESWLVLPVAGGAIRFR